MSEVLRTCIVNVPAKVIFDLVCDIDDYQNFLPWCNNSKIILINDNIVVGKIEVEYLKIKMSFTTKNTNINNEKIQFNLVEGPFKFLHGYWDILPLDISGSKVTFSIKYKLVNGLLEKVIDPVFNIICNSIIDCFIREAKKRNVNSGCLCKQDTTKGD